MAQLEIRIAVGARRGPAAVDDVTLEQLLMALRGRALSLRGTAGRRLAIVECRRDHRPSSSAAFIAVVDIPEADHGPDS